MSIKTFIHTIVSTFNKDVTKQQAVNERKMKDRLYDGEDVLNPLDLASLEVLHWTPANLTRAERLLIYTLTFGLRPASYLEIGTFQGGSALIVSAAMKASENKGHLTCIDPMPQITDEHWALLSSHSTLIKGRSPGVLPEAHRMAGAPFDLVFIDGDHTYQGVVQDAQGVLPFLTKDAYILFHDSFNPDVDRGIRYFLAQHPRRVLDCGILTREATVEGRNTPHPVTWGGLRLTRFLG